MVCIHIMYIYGKGRFATLDIKGKSQIRRERSHMDVQKPRVFG